VKKRWRLMSEVAERMECLGWVCEERGHIILVHTHTHTHIHRGREREREAEGIARLQMEE